MDFIMSVYAWWTANSATIMEMLSGALIIALAWPGDHPDKEIKWFLDKFSKK